MSLNSSNSSGDVGNNIQHPIALIKPEVEKKKQISPALSWCFTYNNYTDEIVLKFQEIIKEKCKIGFFNKEVASTGTPHLQGYIEFYKKNRPLNMFPAGAHWSKARGNQDQNFKYCDKDAHENNPMTFIHNYKGVKPVKIIEELRPFQVSILSMLDNEPEDGKIIWIYDKKGQIGKTKLLKYLHVKKGVPFSYGGKASDIINLAWNNKEYLQREDKPAFVYNFGRDVENNKISYKSMEQLSDGLISNTKFEAGCFAFNNPHVLILANCKPKIGAFSEGRLKLYTVNDLWELIPYTDENNIKWLDDDEA